jgi:AraC-like DNA-binding protein
MGEFTINGTPSLTMLHDFQASTFQPAFKLPDSQNIMMPTDYGIFSFQHWKGSSSDLWLSQYQMKENATLYGASDEPVLELQFMLEEGIQHHITGMGVVSAPRSSFNLYYQPYVENTIFLRKGTRSITFDVHLKVSELENYCSYLPKLGPFLEDLISGRFALLRNNAHPTTGDLMHLINAILHAPSRPSLQQMILQPQIDALIIQALCYLTESKKQLIKATDGERKIIAELNNYLIDNPDSSLTLKQLSKKFAINTFKMKLLFREIYGIPVHSFAIRHRMYTSCELLRNTDAPISEIAYEIGYQTPGSFSAEFKEWFLMTPSEYRRSQR